MLLLGMRYSAEECRRFADQYQAQAAEPGVSPRMATVLKNIARSFAGLASQ
jgi:hypothetical protein